MLNRTLLDPRETFRLFLNGRIAPHQRNNRGRRRVYPRSEIIGVAIVTVVNFKFLLILINVGKTVKKEGGRVCKGREDWEQRERKKGENNLPNRTGRVEESSNCYACKRVRKRGQSCHWSTPYLECHGQTYNEGVVDVPQNGPFRFCMLDLIFSNDIFFFEHLRWWKSISLSFSRRKQSFTRRLSIILKKK